MKWFFCPTHGKLPAKKVATSSRDGKEYDVWGCPRSDCPNMENDIVKAETKLGGRVHVLHDGVFIADQYLPVVIKNLLKPFEDQDIILELKVTKQ